MELDLGGKSVVNSGAASGIGRACAWAFAEEGARLSLIDIDAEAGQALQSELEAEPGADCAFVAGDISAEFEVAAAVETIAARYNGIDVVVGSAGTSGPHDCGIEQMIASDSSFVAAPGMVPYNASKGAVLQLTRALSVDLMEDGIRVNCVCPSVVDTAMSRADLGQTAETFAAQDYPVQRPEQVANHGKARRRRLPPLQVRRFPRSIRLLPLDVISLGPGTKVRERRRAFLHPGDQAAAVDVSSADISGGPLRQRRSVPDPRA